MSLKLSILVMLCLAFANDASSHVLRQAQPFQPTQKPPARPKNVEPVYQFGYLIDNNIDGNLISHNEQSVSGKVTGMYAYDDRNMYRVVTYEADEFGFRIISDVRVPSEKVGHPDGIASVIGFIGNETYEYTFKNEANQRQQRRVVI